MLVMYGTLHVPFSPGTRPKFTVPSASRGVGRAGAGAPRPPARPPPPPCRAPSWAGAPAAAAPPCGACACNHAVDANKATAVAPESAVRRVFVTTSPLRKLRGNALARACEQALPGRRHQDGRGVAGGAAVLGQAALDGHLVTDLHGVSGPAVAHQAVGAAHLHRPVRHLLRLLIDDVDVEEGVWVHPLDLGDGAGVLERLASVELRREGVMRKHAP